MKLLAISVTYYMPQNRVSDIITHVTLDTINGACQNDLLETLSFTKICENHHAVKCLNGHGPC